MGENEAVNLCAKMMPSGFGFKRKPCGRRGKVEVGGVWYCGVHDPARREERDRQNRERWKREGEARLKQRRIERAKEAVVAAALVLDEPGRADEEREREESFRAALKELRAAMADAP